MHLMIVSIPTYTLGEITTSNSISSWRSDGGDSAVSWPDKPVE